VSRGEPTRSAPEATGACTGGARAACAATACALATTLLGACSALSLPEFDHLARTTGARTILLEQGLSLYSPFDARNTRQYLDLLVAQRDEVFSMFELEHGPVLVVRLRPDESMSLGVEAQGQTLSVQELDLEPDDGVLGSAGQDVATITVPAPRRLRLEDGREIEIFAAPSLFTETIRHELAHVASARLGLGREGWLREGLAHAVESVPFTGGRFVLEDGSRPFRLVSGAPRDPAALEAMLAWNQSYPPTDEDRRMRQIAFSFTVFAVEVQGAASLRAALAGVDALDAGEILALQPRWSAWLDELEAGRAR